MKTSSQIKVVIAEDHRLYREMLSMALRRGGIEISGEVANGHEIIDTISNLQPDVLLLDIVMPEVGGIEVIQTIKAKSPKTKVLILTVSIDEALVFKALKAGAKGYISKDISISDLIKAIQTVHVGELWVERKLIARFIDEEFFSAPLEKDRLEAMKDELTPRELEVLSILSKGSTNKEIAKALFISEKTVKSHLNSIFKKLKVTQRLQAILYTIRGGLG